MTQPTSIAFLPWIGTAEPITIGRLRLLPYDRGLRSSGNLPRISKKDQDRILGAYTDRKDRRVQLATLVEIGEWHSGEPLGEETASELFNASSILAFAAIANRTLFAGGDCVNSTHYRLVTQAFQPGHDGFAFFARRRDGGSWNYWSGDEFGFQRPLHGAPGLSINMDVNLVEALLQLAPGNPLLEAVREFNSTNSDSADVAPHVELVMCHTALEWLTGLWTSKGIIDALNGWFPKDRGWVGNGPMKESWLHRWTPKDDRLLTAWARDFCALRGVSAHANQGARNLWSHFSHLAFVSLLLPAVAKIVLEKHSLYQRTQQDMEEAAAIENYLLFDPQIPVRVGKQSPWSQVRSMTALRRISGGLRSR